MSRGLLGKIYGGNGGKSAAPVVGLAGKHPAWPDHIRGHGYLGREDPTLESAVSSFYRALEKVIDSGAWGAAGKAAPPGMLPYGHEVLWLIRSGGQKVVIAGRLWPGRDQTGREQYPMMGWALLPGWSEVGAAAAGLPVLEEMEARVRDAGERVGVEAAIAGAETRLAAETPGRAVEPGAALRSLESGGLDSTRLLARLARDAGFLSGQAGANGGHGGAATVVRSELAPASREGMALLLSTAARIMPDHVDVLLIRATGSGYADIIAHTSQALKANELVQIRRDESVIVPVQRESGVLEPQDEALAAEALSRLR